MSDLNAVRRRKERLIAYQSQIEEELRQLDQVEELLVRLAAAEDDKAVIGMAISSDLAQSSAAEAAQYILSHADKEGKGMHYSDIVNYAVRFGYRTGKSDPGIDTMRRAMLKRSDLFESLGDGRFRLLAD